jgi:hypothetical protein
MFLKNEIHTPDYYAGKILIQSVNLSKKTKAFLKGKVTTLRDFSKLSDDEIDQISCEHVRRQLEEFKKLLIHWKEKQKSIKGLSYSRNIQRPQIPPRSGEKEILIALLLAEPLFGNRRKVTAAKRLHLPALYTEVGTPEARKGSGSFPLQRFSIAS